MRMCKQNSAAGNVKQHIMFHGYRNETKLPFSFMTLITYYLQVFKFEALKFNNHSEDPWKNTIQIVIGIAILIAFETGHKMTFT